MTNSAYKEAPKRRRAPAAVLALPAEAAAIDPRAVARQAAKATKLLKSLANPHRLMILCHLVEGEQSVGALERALRIQQAHLSQHLARLREAGLVRARRESRSIYYRIGSAEAASVLALLYRLYCPQGVPGDAAAQQKNMREDEYIAGDG